MACLAFAGAVGPAGAEQLTVAAIAGNATLAVRAAIAATSFGDVVDFAPGDYHLDTVALKPGVTYRSAGGATLHARGDGPIFTAGATSRDIAITGLTFVGSGRIPTRGAIVISGDGSANSARRISITQSRFENNGVFFIALRESRIDHNRFEHIRAGAAGVFGYRADDSSFSGNTFVDVYQGMSLIFGGGKEQGRNIVVAGNTGDGVSRMGIEIQGQDPPQPGETTNLLVQGNHFVNWTAPVSDGNTIAYSIVTDGGQGTRVLDNYAQGKVRTGYGIEISGPGAIVNGNYIDGFAGGVIGYSPNEMITGNNTINQSGRAITDYGPQDITITGNTNDDRIVTPRGARMDALGK